MSSRDKRAPIPDFDDTDPRLAGFVFGGPNERTR